jgi:hypothetical protein
MVYLLKMVIFHGALLNKQRVMGVCTERSEPVKGKATSFPSQEPTPEQLVPRPPVGGFNRFQPQKKVGIDHRKSAWENDQHFKLNHRLP